jgi:Spy/CpxP family protein refolding chaperone
MKKTLIVLATMLAIPLAMADAPTASPPPFGGPGPQGGPNIERMARVLDLTPEQREKLKSLYAEHQTQRQAMRESHRARMQDILTEEQLDKWNDLRQMRHARMGMRGGNCDGMGPHGWR